MNAPYTVETIGGRDYKRANGVAVLATPEESAMFAYAEALERKFDALALDLSKATTELANAKRVEAMIVEVQTPAPATSPSANGKPKRAN